MKPTINFSGWHRKNLILIVLCLGLCFPRITFSQPQESTETEKFDVIIVPGIPFKEEGWGWIMQTRIYWAKILYDRGIARKIMFSGGAIYTPYCEAIIMSLYAEKIGIPSEDILLETEAEHGVENVYFSYLKARALGYQKIALATDPFQCWYLKNFIRKKVDKNIVLIPIKYRELKSSNSQMGNPTIDYKKAYTAQFMSILERDSRMERRRRSRGEHLTKLNNKNLALYNDTLTSKNKYHEN